MITLNQLPSSQFFIALAKDIDALNLHSSEYKFLTAENVGPLNCAKDISENIDILEKYLERVVLWFNSGESDPDLLYDLGQNLANITREADQPLMNDHVDVREMLDHELMESNLNRLIAIITRCEMYPKSTYFNLALMNALSIMWMFYETVHIAVKFFDIPCDSSHLIGKFLPQYEVTKLTTHDEEADNKEYGLKFIRHDEQVVFNEEETRQIEEAAKIAADEERVIQETCEEIRKTNDLQKQLAAIVGDKVKVCQSIEDCKKVKALANLLRAIYVFTINVGMVDDEVAFKGAWELLNHPNEKPSDGMLGAFEIGNLTPYSIAYWLNELFGSKLEASFVTSMEIITLNPNELYHYDKSSMVMIQNLT